MIDPVLKKLYQELKHGLQGTGKNIQHSKFNTVLMWGGC